MSAPDAAPAARPHSPAGLVVGLSVLLLALLVAIVVGAVLRRDLVQRADARAAALASARQEALNLTSIDSRAVEADLKRVLDGATGEFRADFAQRSTQLRSVLAQNAVVAEGRVLDAALVRGDRDTATALVVVDSSVKNKAAPQGRSNTYRMQLDLERHGGRWLTATLQFVG